MTFYNENAYEPRQGHNEMARPSDDAVARNTQPSVNPTDRYNLGPNAGWLLRQYNIVENPVTGKPEFEPIETVAQQLTRMADEVLGNARGMHERDENEARSEKFNDLLNGFTAAHDAVDKHYSELSEWIPRTTVVWPVDNQVGRALFNASFGEYKLAESIANAVRYGRIPDASAASVGNDDKLAQQDFWVTTHYLELGLWDAVSQALEAHDYNYAPMLRSAFRQQAQMDTKKFLSGTSSQNPPTATADSQVAEADIRAQLLSVRRA